MSISTRWGAAVPTWRPTFSRNVRYNLTILLISAMAACAESSPTFLALEGSTDLSSASVQIVGGNNQSGEVASLAPGTLAIHVLDASGRPIPSAPVEWAFSHGAGQVDGSERSTIRVEANEHGRSEMRWVFGDRAGLQEVEVSVRTNDGGLSPRARFRATTRPSRPERLFVEPGEASAIEGESVAFDADLIDRFGNGLTLPSDSVEWESSNASVAAVGDAGVVTAVGEGPSEIMAYAQNLSGSAALTVLAPEPPAPGEPHQVTDLTVVEATQTSIRLRWTQVEDGDGNATPTALRFGQGSMSWNTHASSQRAIPAGSLGTAIEYEVTGLTPDTRYQFQVAAYRVHAPADTVYGARSSRRTQSTDAPPPVLTTVLVTPGQSSIAQGGSATLDATAFDQNGQPMTPNSWTWTSSNSSVASVNGSGTVTANAVGSATITATADGISNSATVTVNASAPIVDAVVVSPTPVSMEIGESQSFDAVVFDADGNLIHGLNVSWSSSNGSVVSVNGGGVAQAQATGSATINATVDGVSGSANVTVSEPTPIVDWVVVNPNSVTLDEGESRQLNAQVFDTGGNPINGLSVSWNSANNSIATVNGAGVVQATGEGTVTVTATVDGVVGAASITVNSAAVDPVVDEIVVNPSVSTVNVGGTRSFLATVYDTNGNVMHGESVSWSSSNASVFSVNGAGDGAAHAEGNVTITAQVGGVTGTASVTVPAPPIDPPPPGTPFWETNWDFNSTAEMIAANTNGFSLGEVTLESGTLFDGSPGKFMRAHLAGDGSEDDTNYDIPIPGAGHGTTSEVWIEIWLRFDDNWHGTSDDKTFFIWPQNGSRWEIHYGLGQRVYGGPSGAPGGFFVVSDDGSHLDVEDVWDGEWHRHRLHLRPSSSPGAQDGAFEWWFDDLPLVTATQPGMYGRGTGVNIDTGTNNTYFHGMRLGANADPRGSGIRDWGRIRIFTSDPGWS